MSRTITIFITTFKTLSFSKIKRLLNVVLPHPIFAIVSLYATFKAFTIAKKYFPKTNSSDGIGNAFRHAFWTCLISMYCSKISSPERSLEWCQKITDLHEELFPNEPLQKQMDLHNNKVGINIYKELLPTIHRQFFETSFFVQALFKKVKTAQILSENHEVDENELVYLK